MKGNTIRICLIACVACIGGSMVYSLQQYITMNYVVAATVKIVFFSALPIAYCTLVEHVPIEEVLFLKGDIKKIKTAVMLGIGVVAVILTTYVIMKAYIDLDLIASELMATSSINARTFPFIAVYIIFGNSFLEEYFFRGFIFLSLYNKGYEKFAYIFSALLFSVYHVAIFKTWFSMPIMALILIGLFGGGLIFNYLDTKTNSILNSWTVHIFADIAIILIGIKMFYL
ncbi:CPBP family intramembrane glutamic endopeptidase [Cellulosilyticum sp. I15G10I2]|uniref:CPBP family intramembrane glutamic endopeptidase n=1 Tax=Cellulosilyticum sp. I15G10I2 TaxID=1892843 RepID=UPI0009437096|nr:type II CAAX endopeptidase family protein [Cellulosilyticum sp. I15G10I2]